MIVVVPNHYLSSYFLLYFENYRTKKESKVGSAIGDHILVNKSIPLLVYFIWQIKIAVPEAHMLPVNLP